MTIFISDSAEKHINSILKHKPKNYAMRISVEGGGCSGFSYKYSIVETQDKDDLIFKKNGAKIVVDPISFSFLKGAKIDFIENLIGKEFVIINPNARSLCGCGISFSI